MFIHLGGDTVIRSKDVIAILDKQAKETSEITEEFLTNKNNVTSFVKISKDNMKSIVITRDKIYISPISSATLKKRAIFIYDNEID